jgi:hypothetical protein
MDCGTSEGAPAMSSLLSPADVRRCPVKEVYRLMADWRLVFVGTGGDDFRVTDISVLWNAAIARNPRVSRRNSALRQYQHAKLGSGVNDWKAMALHPGVYSGFSISGGQFPELQDLNLACTSDSGLAGVAFDLFIWPNSFDWSVVIPHEADVGPLFMRPVGGQNGGVAR